MKRLAYCATLALIAGCASSKSVTPEGLCTRGEVRCAPSGTQELVCEENAAGVLVLKPHDCALGTRCDIATGRCPDLCGGCDAPPNACYKPEGTCWNFTCEYAFADANRCDDLDECTIDDVCHSGVCRPGRPRPCTEIPDDSCVDEQKLRAYTRSGSCSNGACQYPSAVVDCPLGCTAGKCQGDPCQGVSCNAPPNGCYKAEGICSQGICNYLPDDGKPCDDHDPCTENDQCRGGKCAGQAKVCTSPPASKCEDTTTLLSYAAVGRCDDGDCNYTPQQTACTRGCDATINQCKDDACEGVDCSERPSVCYKRDSGRCEEGKCVWTLQNGVFCNDDDPCTSGDRCKAGVCKGDPKVCDKPPANSCKDDDTLVVHGAQGGCDASGDCIYPELEVTCSHGCVDDACAGDPCAGVTCDDPPNDQCYGATGICSGGNCTYLPTSDAPCDDGNPCTAGDVCNSSGKCAGEPYVCDDGLVCTGNVCDGEGGCTFPVNAGSCLLLLSKVKTCVQSSAQNEINACQYCDPATPTVWSAVGGKEIQAWSFDDESLQGWTVTPNPDYPDSPVTWQVDKQRAASPPSSAYFGDKTARNYKDYVKAVTAALTSPEITLPADGGKLCLGFRLFTDTENSKFYDQVILTLIEGERRTKIWTSGKEASYADSQGAFLAIAADLTAAAGQTVRFEFAFDAFDGYDNEGEGVYLDDIRLMKDCTP